MKVLCLFTILLVSSHCYTKWDNWHNLPTAYVPSPSTVKSAVLATPAKFSRNLPASLHPSGAFSNFSKIVNQYMYWPTANSTQLIFCKPKYYLLNETICQKDPYYWGSLQSNYCLPNHYNSKAYANQCDSSYALYSKYPCCFSGASTSITDDMNAVDPYTAPLF